MDLITGYTVLLGRVCLRLSQPEFQSAKAPRAPAKAPFIHSHPAFELILTAPEPEGPGRITLIPPFGEHRAHFDGRAPAADWISLSFEAGTTPGTLPQGLADGAPSPADGFLTLERPFSGLDSVEAWKTALAILEQRGRREPGWYQRCCALAMVLLTNIATLLPSPGPALTRRGRITGLAPAMDQWLHENYMEPQVSASGLASALSISQRQLYRELQRLYGKGFRAVIMELRMVSAEEYRRDFGKTAEEIAELVGYGSGAAFLRAYRMYYGHPFSQGEH